jgi:hypothetical protein
MERIDLKQIERNIFRDYFQDGLSDMMFGAYFLLIGLGLLVGTVAPFIVLPILFFAPALRGLKKRFTYPRTGYVELRQGDPQTLLWFVLGSLVLGLVALVAVLIATGVIVQPAQWYRWMPIFFGIWLTGTFLGLALRVGLAQYYVVAGVALASGPICALVPVSGKLENIGLFFAVVGAVSLAWGAVTFLRFLRRYPVSTERADDVTD